MAEKSSDPPVPDPPPPAADGERDVVGRIRPISVALRPGERISRMPVGGVRVRRAPLRRRDPRAEDDTGPFTEHVLPMDVDAVGSASIRPRGARPGPSPDMRARKLVDELRSCAPGEEGHLIAPLLELGDDALVAAMRVFPGVRWFNRYRPHKKIPKGRDLSPISRLLVEFADRAVPFVLPLLESEDADDRYMGALISVEIGHADLVVPVGRLLFDEDAPLRDAALEALVTLPEDVAMQRLSDSLRGQLANPMTERSIRLLVLRALGGLRRADAVPEIIATLGSPLPDVRDAARRVLLKLTGHDHGGSTKRWLAWHQQHEKRSRLEWLIVGLGGKDAQVREIARRELIDASGEDLGYRADAPWILRFAAQRRYRRWYRRRDATSA